MIPGYYSISQEANDIKGNLEAWASTNKAQVFIMASMRHLWEQIYGQTTLNQPRILITFAGEKARGGFNQANTLNRVDRKWTVVLMRGHGFNPALSSGEGDARPFYDQVEELRDQLRIMIGITREAPIDYMGIESLPAAGAGKAGDVFLDGYIISFSTANDIPAVVFTDPNQQPVIEGETTV